MIAGVIRAVIALWSMVGLIARWARDRALRREGRRDAEDDHRRSADKARERMGKVKRVSRDDAIDRLRNGEI